MRGKSSYLFGLAAAEALCALVAASPAFAAQSYGYAAPQPETPAAALDRCLRVLATSPKDFASLIAAGKAAIAIGDPQAAAGFFARADEVSPRSPLPQAGMAAVAVANGEPKGAMPYFTRAIQLGATVPLIGSDRGLAYDLMGMQAQAQADYRAALSGPDRDEARRRLALSLAISGDRNGALQTLAPLQSRPDVALGRTRAFILALTGDPSGAMAVTNAAMPGSSASVAPFLQRLPALAAGQKAAAVNLGIFPDSSGGAMASISTSQGYSATPTYTASPAYSSAPSYSAPRSYGPQPPAGLSANGDRLAGIDQLLRAPDPVQQTPAQPAPQVAYSMPTVQRGPTTAPAARAPSRPRVWLQLASGPNAAALPDQFRRIKSKGQEVLNGIHGFVASAPDRSRLLIGPFSNRDDAETFAQGLEELNISAFSWTNSPSDTIVPLNDAS